jgi:biopolymer transport protein ExbB
MWSIVQAAGWPIWFLIVASIVAVALIFERFRALRTNQIVPATALRQAINLLSHTPEPSELSQLSTQGNIGPVMAAGVYAAPQGTAAMRVAMEDALHLELHKLNRYLPALSTISTVAPLLGLFGTVIGMIHIFVAQPGAMNTQQLSAGISEALYNTALGIFVAIMAMLAHRYFCSRVEHFTMVIEATAGRLLREAQVRGFV